MRFNGTLKKWNDEKGFGFIEPVGGGEDLFVHISEFPRNSGRRPQIGDKITFEITTHRDGKKKAVAVQPIKPATKLPAHFAQPSPNDQTRPRRRSSDRLSRFKWVATVLTLASVLAVGLNLFDKQKPNTTTPVQQAPLTQLPVQATPSRFSCDGRKHCSQMHSCEEATFFLKNCPGVEMDGNHDGVPCEQQWCTSPLSR